MLVESSCLVDDILSDELTAVGRCILGPMYSAESQMLCTLVQLFSESEFLNIC
jgi:hypothetical protein